MQASQVTRAASSLPARPYASASSGCSRRRPAARGELGRVGRGHEPVRPSVTTSSGPPASVVVSTGFSEQERLVGDHPEVLVDRRVVDGEAAGVERGELGLVDPAGELGAPVQPALARERLEPLAVGALAGDHDAQAGVERGRLEQEVVPLRAVEPADGEDEVAVAVVAVGQLLRRVRQHLGREPGRALDPVGDVARGGEEPLRLAERDPVQVLDRAPQRPVLRFFGELAQIGSVELVRLAELVQHPDALVRVPDDVRGELRREHEVDRPPVRLGQVEQAPEERLVEHARARVPLERNGDELGLVVAGAQLVDERVRHDLGAPANEGHLRRADRNSHERCFNSASSCATRASRSSISRSAAALKERWS